MLFWYSPLTPLTSPMLLLRVTLLLMLLQLLEPIHCWCCWCFFDLHLSPLTSPMQLLLLCLPLVAILLMLLHKIIYCYCCCVLYYAPLVAGNVADATIIYPLLDAAVEVKTDNKGILIVSVVMFIKSLHCSNSGFSNESDGCTLSRVNAVKLSGNNNKHRILALQRL